MTRSLLRPSRDSLIGGGYALIAGTLSHDVGVLTATRPTPIRRLGTAQAKFQESRAVGDATP
ncbi:MAG: hypothetical protein R3B96_09105 [Pirellulaceae bacterium]